MSVTAVDILADIATMAVARDLVLKGDGATATEPTSEHYKLALRDATLGVGHVWTETACPAYRSLDPTECSCR